MVYRSSISRPKVLLVVSHPAVGSGLETLLRLERRYEVRRVARLAEAIALARSWRADAALVDAAVLPSTGRAQLGVPALVLAGGEPESMAVTGALDDSRGWVAKDAPAAELVSAVEKLFTGGLEPRAGSLAVFAVGVLLLILVLLFGYLLWLALV